MCIRDRVDAAVRASADTVTVVVPYFGYGRQDRKDQPRVPISSRVMIDILTDMGADRIITMDLHSTQIQGFAKIPFDNLYSRSIILESIASEKFDPKNSVVLAPDVGSAKMSQGYAKNLGMHFALIDKRRYAPNKAEVSHLIGDLDGMDVLIIDDMIDTAGTLTKAAQMMLEHGAKSVRACCTHPVLSGPAHERISNSVLTELVTTDTIPLLKENKKIKILTVADLFGTVIENLLSQQSISKHFIA